MNTMSEIEVINCLKVRSIILPLLYVKEYLHYLFEYSFEYQNTLFV